MDELNLKNSKLILEGTPTEHEEIVDLIKSRTEYLTGDKEERKQVYKIRRDFYVGDHAKYTNIVGLQQKEKKGHANAVVNYAGKTVTKIAYSLANNPPSVTYPVDSTFKPTDAEYEIEDVRTQAVEDFTDTVLTRNMFWKRPYRRGVFNQVELGDFALKVYPLNIAPPGAEPEWEIKVVSQEKMENLLVGWRSDDPKQFDFVICDEQRTVQSIKDEWGIDVPHELLKKSEKDSSVTGGEHNNNQQWGRRNTGLGGRAILPSGNNRIPTVRVREYDDPNFYGIMIEDQLVQYAVKDNVTFPKIPFYIIGENIPNPGSPWSIADIDYLIDPNIELNEASNDERDQIRVGSSQKFIAYNMSDFDPESVKPGSGGVIFIDSVDGSARFEPLQGSVNTYPADSFLNRHKKHIHDLGIPEVSFGGATGNSGRSKAIDYQSMVDLTIFKRDSWEIVLTQLCEKIQQFGYFFFRHEFFLDAKTGEYKTRYPEFDWSDILPITESDKIVNVLNKVQMGLPFKLAFKELGYRDVDAVINLMKQEAVDPLLMAFRAKMFELTPGVQSAQAQMQATQMAQQTGMDMGEEVPGASGAPTTSDNAPSINAQNKGPVLTSSQNSGREGALPMSQTGGTTSYSSGKGFVSKMRQNLNAQ